MCILQTINCNTNTKGAPHGIEFKDFMRKMVICLVVMFTPRVRVIKMSQIAHFVYFLLITATIWAKHLMHQKELIEFFHKMV